MSTENYLNISVEIPLSKLRPNSGQIEGLPKNPRIQRGEQLDRLKKSIQEQPEMLGLRELLVYPYGEEFVVIGGNMRLKALKDLGYKFAPCKVIPAETSAEALKAYTIKDNNNFGDWDAELLRQEWDEEQLNDWGLDITFEPEVDRVELGEEPDLEDKPVEVEGVPARVKPGEVWALGDHRLYCGDATAFESYWRLLGSVAPVLVFTDPPYGMKKEAQGVANDNLNFDDLLEFNRQWLQFCIAHSAENASLYVWGIDEPLMDIYSDIIRPAQKRRELSLRNLITWDKGSGQGQREEGRTMYATADEKCLFFTRGNIAYGREVSTWFEGFEEFRALFVSECESAGWTIADACRVTSTYASHYSSKSQYAFPKREDWERLREASGGVAFSQDWGELRKRYEAAKVEWLAGRTYFDNTHDNFNNVWHFTPTSQKERELTGGHATPKPLALCARGVKTSSRPGDAVLDVFGGSGSTLIACEQLGRRCYCMELDPHYCDVILHRWETLTGKEARKL